MTDATNHKTNSPALIAYHVRDRGHDESFWTRIGAAWPHEDGNGFTVQFETLPVLFDGRITLRQPKPKQ